MVMGIGMAIGAGSCARTTLYGRAVEVDRIDGEVATVIDRGTGEVVELPRTRLPENAREGSVVVDGWVDPSLTAELRLEVQSARAQLRRVGRQPGTRTGSERGARRGLSLEADDAVAGDESGPLQAGAAGR